MISLLLVLQLLLVLITAAFAFAAVIPPIVGGGNANIEDYPYQIGLEYENNFQFCGGSIVSEKFIVTAAHCIAGDDVGRLRVRVGANVSSNDGEIHLVAKGTIHPKHSFLNYDAAVLELESPLQFSQSVNKIALPDGDVELEAGTIVNITGYGVTIPSQRQQRLQAVQVPIVSREDCRKAYEHAGQDVSEDMICAGVLGTGGQDSCQGDSGGPLSYEGKLYGIVSWGHGCAKPDFPGVYSNVVHLLPFIKEVTGL